MCVEFGMLQIAVVYIWVESIHYKLVASVCEYIQLHFTNYIGTIF